MKIAFFIDNKNISNVDCTSIKEGNPGIGGTEYMILLISYLLNVRNNGIEVILLPTSKGFFPSDIKIVSCKDLKDGYIIANEMKCNYFIFKHMDYYVNDFFSKLYSSYFTKIIPWCHNFCSFKSLRFYAKSTLVERIICVGKEQMDLYIDHLAFLKSDYIFNCVDINPSTTCSKDFRLNNRDNIVTYIGSLVPEKGFSVLAKAWRRILHEVPDAELFVVGTGKLYNRNQKLGEYGIAEAKFEKKFIRYLLNGNDIINSVHFMGIMGVEKYELLSRTKVGVPNPAGLTETFGLSAVEMQLCGAKIATIKCPGYLDTVKNGILYKKKSQLACTVIKQLKSTENNYLSAKQYIDKHFSIDRVLIEWERLFLDCIPKEQRLNKIIINNNFRGKKLKYMLYKLKLNNKWLYNVIPSVENLISINDKIFHLKSYLKKLLKWAGIRMYILY